MLALYVPGDNFNLAAGDLGRGDRGMKGAVWEELSDEILNHPKKKKSKKEKWLSKEASQIVEE